MSQTPLTDATKHLNDAIQRMRQASRKVKNVPGPRLGVNQTYQAVPLSVVEYEMTLLACFLRASK